MTWTYREPGSDAGRDLIRLLVTDINRDHPVFEDEELDAFIALVGDSAYLAAAEALDTIAVDEVLTSKVLRTQDLSTDGAKVAESLRARAAGLRRRAAELDEDEGFFDVVTSGSLSYHPELTDWYSC